MTTWRANTVIFSWIDRTLYVGACMVDRVARSSYALQEEMIMRDYVRRSLRIATLAAGLAATLAVAAFAQYTMTVNKDRLLNAQNEPQNWLMMNGDYGSTRYSKLSQINRDNVKNLRMV